MRRPESPYRPNVITFRLTTSGMASWAGRAAVSCVAKEGIDLSIARAKTPLTARLSDGGLPEIPLHPTVPAAVEAAA